MNKKVLSLVCLMSIPVSFAMADTNSTKVKQPNIVLNEYSDDTQILKPVNDMPSAEYQYKLMQAREKENKFQ